MLDGDCGGEENGATGLLNTTKTPVTWTEGIFDTAFIGFENPQ